VLKGLSIGSLISSKPWNPVDNTDSTHSQRNVSVTWWTYYTLL